MIIASNEDGNIKYSEDYGVTWYDLTSSSSSEIATVNDNKRIISLSDSGNGISYSDDGGATWINSNITDRSWCCLTEKDDCLFCGSMTDYGILYSTDNGETWSPTEITGGAWEESDTVSDTVYMSGSGLVKLNSDGSVEVVNGEETRIIGEGIFLKNRNSIVITKKFTEETLGNLIDYIINKIIKPYIYMKELGVTTIKDSNDLSSNATETKSKIVFNSSEFYKVKKLESLIDWEEDLGMQDFGGVSVSDLVESDIVDEEFTFESIKGQESSKVNEMLSKIRKYINLKKQAFISNAESNLSYTADVDSIKENSSDDENFATNMTVLTMYLNTEKTTAKYTISKVADIIFSFNQNDLELLLKYGIFETIQAMTPHLKFALKALGEKAEKTGVTQYYHPYSDSKLTYNIGKGIQKSLNSILSAVASNMTQLTDESDKDIISTAASFYKTKRANLIFGLKQELTNITENLFTLSNYNYAQYLTDINTFCNSVIAAKKAGTDTPSYNDYSFKFTSLDIDKYFEDYYKNLYHVFAKYLSSIEFEYFDDQEQMINAFTPKEITRAFIYLKIIYRKFIERCKLLLDYCYDEMDTNPISEAKKKYVTEQEDAIKIWMKRVDDATTDSEICTLMNSIPTPQSILLPYNKQFMANLRNIFNTNSGAI